MLTTTLSQRLRSGEFLLGMQSFSGSAAMVEIMGQAGFDFVMIDLEHSMIDMEHAAFLVRTADSVDMACLVRVRENLPLQISRALASGADGVIVPRVNTAAEARSAVRATRLPPLGERRLSADARHALQRSGAWTDGLRALDERTVTVALIEDIAGVDAIEEILDVEGIGALLFGPADFGMSIGAARKGFGGDVERATFQAMDHVIACARKRQVPVLTTPILNVLDVENALADLSARGVRAVLYSIDTMMTRASLEKLRHAFKTHAASLS